jgi:hypothetical protein
MLPHTRMRACGLRWRSRPACRSGLGQDRESLAIHGSITVGDELTAVDAWPTAGRSTQEVTARILGPPGTPVHLTLKDAHGRHKLVSVVRELPPAASGLSTQDLEDALQQSSHAFEALAAMEQALRDRDTRILELQRQQEHQSTLKDDEIRKLRAHLQVA